MKILGTICCILLVIYNITNLQAKLEPYSDLIKICPVKYHVMNNYEAEEFYTTNNLCISNIPNNFRKIFLYGNIKSKNSAIIKDAKIFLWQVDNEGFYNYKALRSNVDQALFKDNKYFSGNGITTSDNLGNFYFISLYPAISNGLPPHINLRIESEQLTKPYQIRIVLPTCITLHNRSVYHKISPKILDYIISERVEFLYFEINLEE